MELCATLLGNHARNVRNARARARDAATSARQLAAPRTQPALHTTRPTHTAHTHRAPASSHGDMGRGRGQVRD